MKEYIGELFNILGLSRISNEMLDLVKSSIRIYPTATEDSQIGIGMSKIGGKPDLPEGWDWPTWNKLPLAFICQLNLEHICEYDGDKELPNQGMLYFFYEAYNQPWGYDPKDKGCCKVLYYDGDVELLKGVNFPEFLPDNCRFDSCVLDFEEELTIPSSDSLYISKLQLNKEEMDKLTKMEEEAIEFMSYEPIHRLLGHPDIIQHEMETECVLVTNGLYCGDSSSYYDPRSQELIDKATDWKLLLQIDSDEDIGMMWGDGGRIYFWIHKDDLKSKNFHKVWLILQCD
ncbi:YwqG family protein [Caloramator sp. CAR-1]|uniref:YwqG family protein n=1 Tax=Caloramator sp. CAR-1 TaxID=3062777 RepID=UPI0026E47B73|nr:YwqG family protein [Caloramator sp. CAR-1]MDO6355719.1 YwqG family protein [Caloramator sp. CAR-1]